MAAPNSDSPAPLHISGEQVLFLNRQIASMARLNMPLSKGLKILAREVTDPNFSQLIDKVRSDLDEGSTLFDALSKYPDSFSKVYLEILKTGETTGNLAVILDELANYSETMLRVRDKIGDSLTYPLAMTSVTGAFLLLFVYAAVPTLRSVFDPAMMAQQGLIKNAATNREPPFVAQIVYSFSDILHDPLWAPLILLAIGAGIFFLVRFLRSQRDAYDQVMFQLPIFGPLFHKATLLKACRTLRDLLSNGVSMVQSLRMASNITGNNIVRDKLIQITKGVEQGESFGKYLGGDKPAVFPDTIVWKLQIAEEKGIVEQALGEVSDELERQIDSVATRIAKLMGPFIMFFLCIVVGLVAASFYLPMFESLGRQM